MKSRIYLVALVGLAMMLVGSQAWARCYVDHNAEGKNDGSTWTNAYVHPQLALVNGCTEIWVAKGVYTPVLTGIDPTVSFDIPAGTQMYGGFAGNETSMDQRVLSMNRSVLSGDVDHNDDGSLDLLSRTTDSIRGTNSYHIITMYGTKDAPVTPATVLDGFVITAGDNNVLGDAGAGISCSSEDETVTCAPELTNLIFVGNHADNGGALATINTNGDIEISNTRFVGNAARYGGALYLTGTGTARISKSAFVNNSGLSAGGAVEIFEHSIFENVTFTGNSSDNDGGAIAVDGGASTLTNVTLVNNMARANGGAVAVSSGAPAAFQNSIFWGNTATSDQDLLGNVTIEHSIIESGCPDGSTCSLISTENPKLTSLGDYGGGTLAMIPTAGSPAIDRGDDAVCPANDQRGVLRPQAAHCDIGAVEWQPADEIIFRNGFQ